MAISGPKTNFPSFDPAFTQGGSKHFGPCDSDTRQNSKGSLSRFKMYILHLHEISPKTVPQKFEKWAC